jgi:hypothetical protein
MFIAFTPLIPNNNGYLAINFNSILAKTLNTRKGSEIAVYIE